MKRYWSILTLIVFLITGITPSLAWAEETGTTPVSYTHLGKIRRFVDEYVYVPKMLLLMIADHAPQIYDAGQREKLSQMKPKFAKYYFNCALEMLAGGEQSSRPADGSIQASALDELLDIDKQMESEMPHKPKAYGRIKSVSYTHLDVYKRQP